MTNPAIQQKAADGTVPAPIPAVHTPAPLATDVSAHARERARLPRWNCPIPPGSRDSERDPAVVTLRELTVGEIEMAYDMGGANKMKVTNALVAFSLSAIDGRPLDIGSGEPELAYSRMSAPVRSLLRQGYEKIHNSKDADDQAFLDGMVRA